MIFKLASSFFKIGLFTFGGGYAMLPLLEKEVCNKNNWMSYEELTDFYAIAQSTPGVISVNVATYVGYKQAGIKGSIATVVGVTLPSFIVIILIAILSSTFIENEYFIKAFAGVSAVVSVLIFKSVLKMFKASVNTLVKFLFYLTIALLAIFTDTHILILVCFSGIISLLFYYKKIGTKK